MSENGSVLILHWILLRRVSAGAWAAEVASFATGYIYQATLSGSMVSLLSIGSTTIIYQQLRQFVKGL